MRDREKQQDLQDRDTNVGGDDRAGKAAGPTAGRAGGNSTDDAIDLAGASVPRGTDEGGTPAGGVEHGNATRGSETNAAVRPDKLNTPDSRQR
jgi:hypothetical protein